MFFISKATDCEKTLEDFKILKKENQALIIENERLKNANHDLEVQIKNYQNDTRKCKEEKGNLKGIRTVKTNITIN
jgi:hypothetical protein